MFVLQLFDFSLNRRVFFLIIIPFFLDFVAVVQPEIFLDYFSRICCSHNCQTVEFIISQKGSAGFDGVDHTPNSDNAI